MPERNKSVGVKSQFFNALKKVSKKGFFRKK